MKIPGLGKFLMDVAVAQILAAPPVVEENPRVRIDDGGGYRLSSEIWELNEWYKEQELLDFANEMDAFA